MKIVVTGGCGFIGSNFISMATMVYPNVEIINIDTVTYASNRFFNKEVINSKDNYKHIFMDINNINNSNPLNTLKKDVQDADVLVHFAAESSVDKSLNEDDSIFYKTNIIGTRNILNLVKNCNIKKMIHISTDEVYGECLIPNRGFRENDPLTPGNPYSVSKAGGDMLVRSDIRTHNTPVVILRPCNVFGPYQHPEKFIPYMVLSQMYKQDIQLYGDGKQSREWMWVGDLVSAIFRVIDVPFLPKNPVFNVSSGIEINNYDLTQIVGKITGHKDVTYIKDRVGHDRRYSISSKKIIDTYQWNQPTYEETIKRLGIIVDYYTHNIEAYKMLENSRFIYS